MTDALQLDAEIRTDMGKAMSRRLRHTDKVPAIVYGAGKKPIAITLDHRKIIKALENEDFYTQIISLNIGPKKEKVVLKHIQRHSYKPKINHLDFLRIKANEEIIMNIPISILGGKEAPGIKQGGIISKLISEVEISCLPANLPKTLEIDISQMGLNETFHLSQLKLPEGVKLATKIEDETQDQPIISIHIPRIVEEVEAAPAIEEAAPEAAEAEATTSEKEE